MFQPTMICFQFLFLLGLFTATRSSSYQCNSEFPLVTDLSQEDCDLEGKYFEEDHDGCFPGCYSACEVSSSVFTKCL